ncbi:MAG: Ig-like domain repeat protein, partial [Methylotenera sp.]|nr:Ig-like domain repeat protein [Methylotenera sp.]
LTITNTTSNNNGGSGFYLENVRGTVNISNNILQNNGNWGAYIQGNNNPTVTLNNNTISHNGNGLRLQGISGGNFQDNQLINNTGDDLYATGDTNNTFTRLTLGVAHPTTVSFDYINGIIMNGVESPPVDPSGLFNIGKYVDMQGLGSTNVNIKVHYNDSDVVNLNETSLKNFHFNTSWSELPQPNGVNTTERYVYANEISSFSTFAPLGEKPSTMLAVTDVSGLNGQTVNLEATLTNQDGTPLAGKTIDFTVNGTSVGSALTDDNGIATLNYIITLIPGTYTINATFNGDGGYTATDATSTLTVYKNSTSTVVTNVTGVNGQSVQLQATLTNQDGTPLAGKTIDFTVNGTSVGSALTDDDGIATFSYLITLTPDTYSINATFAGDSNYNNTYNTGIMTVYKNATSLAVANVTGTNGQNVNLQATLTNQDGTPLAGKTIQFTVNGANIGSATTGTNGVATLSYTITQTSNTYAIGSIFTEDGNYNGTTGIGTLTVDLKPTAKANIKGGLFNVNKNVYLTMNKPGTIYYTRNGSTPTNASTKYTGYLTISSTTTLKFIAVDLGGNVSPVYTEKYVIEKTAPKVTYTYPKNLRTGQSRTATLYLKFSEKIKASTNWSKIYVKDLKTGKKVSISKWIKGNILYIKTKYKRASLRSYQVYVPYKAVKDFAGNNL